MYKTNLNNILIVVITKMKYKVKSKKNEPFLKKIKGKIAPLLFDPEPCFQMLSTMAHF